MAIGDIIVGIDVGTSKVSTVVGEVNNFNLVEIICSTNCKCSGIQKGKIVDETDIIEAIQKTIKEAEEIAVENGKDEIAIISGIGSRNYYRKFDYEKVGSYMMKKLIWKYLNKMFVYILTNWERVLLCTI